MTHSLRWRLLIGLAVVVSVVGALGGAIAYDWAFDEAIEAQDTVLSQISAVAARTRFDDNLPVAGGDIESQVTIREIGDKPTAKEVRAVWLLKDGLHDFNADTRQSRIMMRTRADGSRFIVEQPTAIRDEVARNSATWALIPFIALLPCLALVFSFVIARSLRPMSELALKLDVRRPDDVSLMPIDGTPDELRPFIHSINRLFVRFQKMMDQQRQFITDAAHELRTPVTALSLQAENLEQADLLSPEAAARLSRLRDGARRTAHLLDQLLALARYEGASRVGDIEVASLDASAKQVVADLLPFARDQGVDLGFDIIEAVDVDGNPSMVSVMIRNLVDNAIRAASPGGKVDVNVYRQDECACISIVDDGPGINEGDLNRVFDPFFRGSRPYAEGTGLGLAIVQRIVAQMNGTVTLANRTDSKSTGLKAQVRLPLWRDEPL